MKHSIGTVGHDGKLADTPHVLCQVSSHEVQLTGQVQSIVAVQALLLGALALQQLILVTGPWLAGLAVTVCIALSVQLLWGLSEHVPARLASSLEDLLGTKLLQKVGISVAADGTAGDKDGGGISSPTGAVSGLERSLSMMSNGNLGVRLAQLNACPGCHQHFSATFTGLPRD